MARTPASFADHPIHPMLIPFPIALFVFSLVCDVIFRNGGAPLWSDMAFYTMFAGVIGALAAAVPGFVDYVAIISGRVRDPSDERSVTTIATTHMALNLTIVVLYVIDLYLRSRTADPMAPLPFWLNVAAVLLLGVSGYLGGSLAYVHRIGVREPTDTTVPYPTFIERPIPRTGEPPQTAPAAPPQRATR